MTDQSREQEPASPMAGDDPDLRPPTDLRRHRQQTDRALILGGFAILFLVGGGLIWYVYGRGAALAGWACMGSGVLLFGLLMLILKLLEKVQ